MPVSQVYDGRENKFSAGNNILNLDGPAYTFSFISDVDQDGMADPTGDLFLDGNGGLADPNTSILIDGNYYEFILLGVGELPDDGKVPEAVEGFTVAKIEVVGFPGGLKLVFSPDGLIDAATWDAFGNGNIPLDNLRSGPEGVCFAAGTLIDTLDGPRAVETLQPGDLVVVSGGGSQPILWCGCSEMRWPGSPENQLPYSIAKGALKNGLPKRDLVVSPQHKILMQGHEVQELYGEPEVLAPVKGLAGLKGVRLMQGKKSVVYYHILLERHEVVLSEGAPTESFYPGPMAVQMVGKAHMREIERLFPGVSEDPESCYGPQARLSLTRRQTETLVESLNASVPS